MAAKLSPIKPKTEWFQTPERITFIFYVRDRSESDVRVTYKDRNLEIVIKLDNSDREFIYSLNSLYAPLSEEPAMISVHRLKVEVSLKKCTPHHWDALEGKDLYQISSAATSAPASSKVERSDSANLLTYPSNRGKDWNAVHLEDAQEEASGDEALNNLFKKIYGEGSDEQRRAMIKSFTESGGTVLSTNWDEVGQKKVEPQPPTGMEAKRISE